MGWAFRCCGVRGYPVVDVSVAVLDTVSEFAHDVGERSHHDVWVE
jgi:hypothetical protein